MALSLDDFRELHEDLGADAAEVLRASWQDATRVFSPKGLEAYLRGANALHALGRGAEPVASFIRPLRARSARTPSRSSCRRPSRSPRRRAVS